MTEKHLSYSGISKFLFCPNAYNIDYNLGAPREASIFTIFGKGVHDTSEQLLHKNIKSTEAQSFFEERIRFHEKEDALEVPEEKIDLYKLMKSRGGTLSVLGVQELYKEFDIRRVVSTEEELYEPIFHPTKELKTDFNFKGFVDLVLELQDESWIVLDWKTAGWGWDARKKSDKLKHYQLTLYKHFFTLKHDLDPKKINKTYFVLLKRDAFKKDGTPRDNVVEFVPVTCGPKKVSNALKVLNDVMVNVDKGFYPKNRLSCKMCRHYKTKWCSG